MIYFIDEVMGKQVLSYIVGVRMKCYNTCGGKFCNIKDIKYVFTCDHF